MSTAHRPVRVQDSQRGFTLIEMMIALLIGVFMLGALLTIVQTNRAVFGNQSQLAQLQDSERMAMSMIADVIQQAGYFPNPTANTLDGTLTAVAPFAVGQAIAGTYSAAVPGDSISVRYMTAGGDGILNCSGLSNPVGGPNTLYVNQFKVANGQLVCTMNGTVYNLVSGVTNASTTLGVTNLTVLYGVKTNAAATGNDVDTYLNASQMTPAYWSSVIAVLIELTFTNPLYTGASSTQPTTITLQRVVGVMNQLGPVE
jgi:type IV pilus assembly protein PilW